MIMGNWSGHAHIGISKHQNDHDTIHDCDIRWKVPMVRNKDLPHTPPKYHLSIRLSSDRMRKPTILFRGNVDFSLFRFRGNVVF